MDLMDFQSIIYGHGLDLEIQNRLLMDLKTQTKSIILNQSERDITNSNTLPLNKVLNMQVSTSILI